MLKLRFYSQTFWAANSYSRNQTRSAVHIRFRLKTTYRKTYYGTQKRVREKLRKTNNDKLRSLLVGPNTMTIGLFSLLLTEWLFNFWTHDLFASTVDDHL